MGVHLILDQDGMVLLLLRTNTGFADGSWSVPGDCLDVGETRRHQEMWVFTTMRYT